MMSSSALADEITINLDATTPYVDVEIAPTEPATLTITTTTGEPGSAGFIDSWVELWQNNVRLGYNDDGAHTATNYLASLLIMPIDAGLYVIRATSYAWAVTNGSQTPTGSYTLNWSGAPAVSPTPTPTPSPSPSESPSVEPTPSPTPEPTATDSPTPSPEATEDQTLIPEVPQTENAEIVTLETPQPVEQPVQPDLLEPEEEIPLQIIEEPSSDTPIVNELELSVEEINEIYIQENTIELELPTALANVPGVETLFETAEAIMNVGSDMTQEQREESQSVVIASVLITQIAQISSVTAISRRNK